MLCEGIASMMALQMIKPIKEEALPTMLKKEKNKNSLSRGVTLEI